MVQEGEPNQSMAQEGKSPKPNPESMHMEGWFRLVMTQESIHAHGVRIPNLDRQLSLYPIAELRTHALLLAAKRGIVNYQPCLTNDMNSPKVTGVTRKMEG